MQAATYRTRGCTYLESDNMCASLVKSNHLSGGHNYLPKHNKQYLQDRGNPEFLSYSVVLLV